MGYTEGNMQIISKIAHRWLQHYHTKKVNLKQKVRRDEKTLYVTKRVDIVKRNTIKNIYVLNDRSTKYMKQKWTELKGKIVVQ